MLEGLPHPGGGFGIVAFRFLEFFGQLRQHSGHSFKLVGHNRADFRGAAFGAFTDAEILVVVIDFLDHVLRPAAAAFELGGRIVEGDGSLLPKGIGHIVEGTLGIVIGRAPAEHTQAAVLTDVVAGMLVDGGNVRGANFTQLIGDDAYRLGDFPQCLRGKAQPHDDGPAQPFRRGNVAFRV